MKFSFRQILASAAGAVIAALIASSFGVTGTIVGVAIGSMAATLGTALVAQSIERGQKAVKQAVVRVPEGTTSTLLRRMGGTGTAGGATSSVEGDPKESEPTEVAGAVAEASTEVASVGAPPPDADAAGLSEAGVAADGNGDDAAVVEDLEPTTVPLLPTAVIEGAGVASVTGSTGVATAGGSEADTGGRRFTWKAFAGTAAIVFLLALGFVTAIELIVNRPTVFTPSSPNTATTTTSTSTPSTTTTSTSVPASSTTTSTTSASSTTSSTASVASTTTTTSNLKATTTTTTTTTPPTGP